MVTSLLTMAGSLIFARLLALLARPPSAVADAASPTLLKSTLSLDSFSGLIKYDSLLKSVPPMPAPRS